MKRLAVIMSTILGLICTTAPVSAVPLTTPSVRYPNTTEYSVQPDADLQEDEQLFGFKGFIAKSALKGIAQLIRTAPHSFIKRAGRTLDDQARDKILRNSNTIADKIDEVAEFSDLVHHRVKEDLYKALAPIIGHSDALMIADVVAWLAL